MSKIIAILFCLACCISNNAQTKGIVVDMETHKPVRDVHFYLNTNKEYVTNWAGLFDIGEKFSSVTISHGSYVTRKMKHEEMGDTIYLLPKMNMLSEVVVYGRKPGPKFDYNGMTSVDQQLANYHGGGFNLWGLATMAVDAIAKKNHKMSKRDKIKKALENY